LKYVSPNAKVGLMVAFEGDHAVYGATHIGDGCFVGDTVVLGHPIRSKILKELEVASDWTLDALSGGCHVGPKCILRSGTIVYEGARLLANVETGHRVLIRENVEVGQGSRIGTNAVLDGSVKVGSNVNIQSAVYLPPGTIVGSGVFIGPYVVVTNDLYPPSPKVLGVTIDDGATIGAASVLIAGVRIGRNAVVAAGSVVTRDVPDNGFARGVPARIVGTRGEYDEKRSAYLGTIKKGTDA
jgi:acetyltransferase-like isoleucine patch superfamily enzyme